MSQTPHSPSEGSASSTARADPRAGPSPQMAFMIAANPRYSVRGEWWNGVVLQQACQAILGVRGT